jgi:hypothetical protein
MMDVGTIMFPVRMIMLIVGTIMFPVGMIMFIVGLIMFPVGLIMFIVGTIMFPVGLIMFIVGTIMFSVGITQLPIMIIPTHHTSPFPSPGSHIRTTSLQCSERRTGALCLATFNMRKRGRNSFDEGGVQLAKARSEGAVQTTPTRPLALDRCCARPK